MSRLIQAIIAHRSNEDADLQIEQAQQIFDLAQDVVDRRRLQAWDPMSSRLFDANTNSTIYQFGYLHRASDLCYWKREIIQASNAIGGTNLAPPGCGL